MPIGLTPSHAGYWQDEGYEFVNALKTILSVPGNRAVPNPFKRSARKRNKSVARKG